VSPQTPARSARGGAPAGEAAGLTLALAQRAAALQAHDIPDDVREIARQCVLDWFGVTLAGSGEDAPRALLEALRAGGEDAPGAASVVGHGARLAPRQAALVNGASSHVLDFDDVNMSFVGHVSAAVLPAALALAEQLDASTATLLTAFVAGYETACTVGVALGRDPYLRGYHSTATVGVFGATAACAQLLELPADDAARALGIAAGSAAGLKSSFGTMTKALQVGQASANGLFAALLAKSSFGASTAAIEAPQGLAAAFGAELDPATALAAARDEWHMRDNLFKYHAACYFTHSAIEGLRALSADADVRPGEIERVRLHVSALELGTCAIAQPATALEVKFSLAHLAAMALLGRSTGVIEDRIARDEEVLELRSLVELVPDGVPEEPTLVEVSLCAGAVLQARCDVNVAATDLAEQRERLQQKFVSLAAGVLGDARASALLETLSSLDADPSVRELMASAGL
jgi:2-methylcitrate dehydratase PrpD